MTTAPRTAEAMLDDIACRYGAGEPGIGRLELHRAALDFAREHAEAERARHRDAAKTSAPTLPPEIEAAIADAGQALVDAWDSAQDGPPHRFVVFVDPEGDPEVAAGWMAMARMHAAAIAAAREAGRREALEGAAGVEEAIADYTEAAIMARPHASGHVLTAAGDDLRAAIAADKAALDTTWRAHDLERDAEVAQAQAATHEACAALQAICAALHVTPSTGSTYCAGAVAMVLERVAADKARAVEGMRPVLSQADAERLVDAFDEATFDRSNPARTALLAALTGAGGGS